MPLIRNVLKPLAKSDLILLGLKAATSETNAAIHKEIFGSGNATLVTLNEEINDVMKIVKSLEGFGLLIKEIRETFKNEPKKQNGRFLKMLLWTLGASLLENLVTGKDTIRAGEGTIRAVHDF